ncbi:MAG: hypothetical protein WCP70_06225 [Methanothrix sp.]
MLLIEKKLLNFPENQSPPKELQASLLTRLYEGQRAKQFGPTPPPVGPPGPLATRPQARTRAGVRRNGSHRYHRFFRAAFANLKPGKASPVDYCKALRKLNIQHLSEVLKMAHPIELGLVLEGEDAKEFLEDLKNPKATKEQIEMFKEAIKLYKEHPF